MGLEPIDVTTLLGTASQIFELLVPLMFLCVCAGVAIGIEKSLVCAAKIALERRRARKNAYQPAQPKIEADSR